MLRVQDLGTSMPSGNQIILSQCYMHKSGAVFWTKDSMTIFRDAEGKPSTALVTVQMASRPTMNLSGPSFAPIAPKPLPTLTYDVPATPMESPLPSDTDMIMDDLDFLPSQDDLGAAPLRTDAENAADEFQLLVDSLMGSQN